MGKVNFGNIKTGGTFDEWIESIKKEIERILAPINEGDGVYLVEVKPDDWGRGQHSIPAKKIGIQGMSHAYLGFAEMEFERHKSSPKSIMRLVNTRFINVSWSIEYRREEYFKLLRRFDPKHETLNDYLH